MHLSVADDATGTHIDLGELEVIGTCIGTSNNGNVLFAVDEATMKKIDEEVRKRAKVIRDQALEKLAEWKRAEEEIKAMKRNARRRDRGKASSSSAVPMQE
jgi:hypothetical protein